MSPAIGAVTASFMIADNSCVIRVLVGIADDSCVIRMLIGGWWTTSCVVRMLQRGWRGARPVRRRCSSDEGFGDEGWAETRA